MLNFRTGTHYPFPPIKNVKNLSTLQAWRIKYFEEVTQVASQWDECTRPYDPSLQKPKNLPLRKMCDSDDNGDNTASEMMYLCAKDGASVQKREKKVVHIQPMV